MSKVKPLILSLVIALFTSSFATAQIAVPPMRQYDVDANGRVDFQDLYAVYYQLIGTQPLAQPLDADVDLSGVVDFNDVWAVNDYIRDFDFTSDGTVNSKDLTALTNLAPLTLTGPTDPNQRFNFNRDTRVDNIDIQIYEQALFRSPWQNFNSSRFDVNNDGTVDSSDAQAVINRLNISGGSLQGVVPKARAPFYDVNGDDNISPLDALLIINSL